MKYFKKNRAFAAAMRLLPAMLVAAAAFIVMNPQSALAASKCYDSFVGQAYVCPETPGYPIDKKAGAKFEDNKCYIISNPDVGWITDPTCNKDLFTVVGPQKGRINAQSPTTCPTRLQGDGGCDIIAKYVNPAIKFVTISIGLILTISIVWGGIQYASARDNSQAISAAKSRITNSILVLVGYSLLWTFLQWLIPGGFLN